MVQCVEQQTVSSLTLNQSSHRSRNAYIKRRLQKKKGSSTPISLNTNQVEVTETFGKLSHA
ncbi:hypothetical protein EXN66_Car016215 [Channa argus]|uniref:Uncharacterized protein n=1 Tax=Channa argus TaxID=215402 RepID=A0A6G1QE56_CHAAH|nr:hypothetical protein EXN66_Car016215 [Channa argus]